MTGTKKSANFGEKWASPPEIHNWCNWLDRNMGK